MADHSKIEWTDATWPIVQGCDPVSPGCTGCYVVPLLHRLAHHPNPTIAAPLAGLTERHKGRLRFTGKVALREDRLTWPLQWRRPRKIFVPSHGDIFHKDVPDSFIDRVFAVMALCPQHTFQVLTKRPQRMREYFTGPFDGDGVYARISDATWEFAPSRLQLPEPPVFFEVPVGPRLASGEPEFGWRRMLNPRCEPFPNVWLGVSIEDRPRGLERAHELALTPAAVRFWSVEPLLADLGDLTQLCLYDTAPDGSRAVHWIIVGGESGSEARPMHPAWARSIRDQCAAAGVPFFFKQWGEWAPTRRGEEHTPAIWLTPDGRSCRIEEGDSTDLWDEPGARMLHRYGKKRAGRLLDGRTHDAMPEARRAQC